MSYLPKLNQPPHSGKGVRVLRLLWIADVFLLAGLAACGRPLPHPGTVGHVDLRRYMGTWYEIARYATDFEDSREKHCIDVVSTLTIRESNRFSIHDSCRNQKAGGKLISIEGEGRAPSPGTAKLRVSFQWPFYTDYWITGLDPNYKWAVVTAPSRRYLWILSRQPTLAADDYDRAVAVAAKERFDVKKLIKTRQSM